MKYTYSTKEAGLKYHMTAKAVNDGVIDIVITWDTRAASYTEAAAYFEEYLNENHEGFTFEIEIVCTENEANKQSNVNFSA